MDDFYVHVELKHALYFLEVLETALHKHLVELSLDLLDFLLEFCVFRSQFLLHTLRPIDVVLFQVLLDNVDSKKLQVFVQGVNLGTVIPTN